MKIKHYRFVVSGVMPFPCDMLRYDMCHPYDSESAAAIAASIHGGAREGTYRVELAGSHPPTDGRWRSFMWTVVDVNEIR